MKELIIAKVGTSTLVDKTGRLNDASFMNIAAAMKAEKDRGADTMLITSGAIGAGAAELGTSRKMYEKHLDALSALAALGQVSLMNKWRRNLEPYHASQHMITPYELYTPEGEAYIEKLKAAFDLGLVPIANENDAVAHDEIKFGDNDQLMARIAVGLFGLGEWDVIKPIILSDVDGLYTTHPDDESAELIRVVHDVDEIEAVIVDTETEHGSGGMRTKKMAARILMDAGLELYLGNGQARDPIGRLIRGGAGTHFTSAA